MLTNKNIVCPENLLNIAKGKGPVKAVIVNAVKKVAIESAKQAVEANLITPLFVGDKSIIEKISKEINWDISKYEIVHEPDENSTAPIAAKLASEGIAFFTSFELATSTCFVVAPIVTDFPLTLIPDSFFIFFISIKSL